MNRVRVAGVGSFVPKRAVNNEKIARAVPGWEPSRIEEKTGIVERRFLWDIDPESGRAIPPPEGEALYPVTNTDMCELALRGAMKQAGLAGEELDAIFLVTCSPDEPNFSHDAMELHRRLGCRTNAFAFVIDDGCGGTPYVMDMAGRMIAGGTFHTVAVIGASFASPWLNRELFTAEFDPGNGRKKLSGFLSMYVFGDGAGAVILRGDAAEGEGILASVAGTGHEELVFRRGGGALRLPHQGRATLAEQAFIVDGPAVARSYPHYMGLCLEELAARKPELMSSIKRYYLHQPNKRVLEHFVERAGLPRQSVACHVDRQGNTSAAGMLILLAEDLSAGTVRLGSGDLVAIASVGANVHYGAQLIRL